MLTPASGRLLLRLLGPMARAVTWTPLALSGAVGLIALRLTTTDPTLRTLDLLFRFRVAAVALAAGAAFVLDDPSERTCAAVPCPVMLRRVARLALLVPVIVVWWLCAAGLLQSAPTGASFPLARSALEIATLTVGTLAISTARLPRAIEPVGGIAAGPALLALALVAATALPPQLALFVYPANSTWSGAGWRWCALLVVASLGLLAASRDPARRRGQVLRLRFPRLRGLPDESAAEPRRPSAPREHAGSAASPPNPGLRATVREPVRRRGRRRTGRRR